MYQKQKQKVMTLHEIETANMHNSAKAAIKLLQHIGKAHGHHLHPYEQQALEQLVSGATCNDTLDLLSAEYFEHIISPVIYHGK